MTNTQTKYRVLLFAALMVLSVFAAPSVAAGTGSPTDAAETNTSIAQSNEEESLLQADSAKPLTISWFRDDGDSNGPYPVMPNEYEDDETGIQMFANAEGDAQLRADDSIALNPNGQWDMVALHVEGTGLEELDPPAAGADKGLVTETFVENDDWDVSVTQANGDKELNVEDNTDGYENPAGVDADVPPVMVFADTDEVDDDFAYGDDPDTGLLVWIDPNRAVLDENGDDAGFETGEEYDVEFDVHGHTETTNFRTVEGDVTLEDSYEPANKFGAELVGESTLAGSTDVELVLETENDTASTTVEVEGNEVLKGTDSAGTIPAGPITGQFDLSGMEGQEFTLTAYAPGPEGGHIDGEPARDDDDYMDDENRIQVAQSSGVIQDIIDPDYTIESADVSDGKPLSVPYGIGYETAAVIGDNTGDGEIALDDSVALDVQGTDAWDGLLLHYETSDTIFEAIDRSPGATIHEKFESSPLSLEVVQTNADGEPKQLDMAENGSGIEIAPDPNTADSRLYDSAEQGIFFGFDLNEVTLYQDGEPVQAEPGETYTATLTIETENGVEEEAIEFELVEGESWIGDEDGEVEIPQSENAEIQLNTELAAGGEWTIAVQSADGSLNVSEEDNVPEGHGNVLAGKVAGSMPTSTAVLPIDTSGLEYDTELTLTASLEEDPPDSPVRVVETTGVIVAPPSASVSVTDQSGDGDTLTVDELDLSDGGFVSVHTDSETGPTIGSSSYLDAGTHSDVEVSLDEPVDEDTTLYVLVHRDTNGNEEFDFPSSDGAYEDAGTSVSGDVEYTLDSSSSGDDDGSDDDGGDDDGTPGFGVPAALIALLGAVLVLHRRE
ncbi:DUF7282 domain-containing protein [Natronorubrum halophilum]|uniref:DUF7282 domain-containing protein n=1 Tax=Natronorubrum halophilum TaxID=1702106 RepID=UPI001EE8C5AE|nr:PGF-CTERM sorting domain-containing protein [Natronorubrum halophilum]